MTRLVVSGLELRPGKVAVPAGAARHARAARLRPGDFLELLDLTGVVAVGTLVKWQQDGCLVDILRVERERGEPPAPLVLALGVLHSEAFSWAVEKATELGATAIQPVLGERVQRRDHRGRTERWRRVAAAAVAQCGRSRPPEVRDPLPLAEVCSRAVGFRLLADACAAVDPSPLLEGEQGATVLVGPEGGFTAAEVDLIRTAGFTGLWLGPRTLRSETAAVAALVCAQHRLGWLSGGRKLQSERLIPRG